MTPLSFVVGARYARGKKRNRFGSVISAFSVLGMALGVTALILVLSVMNGFNREIQLRFQTVTPHASLIPLTNSATRSSIETAVTSDESLIGFLEQNQFVESYSPLHSGYGLLSTSAAQAPAILNGIEPAVDETVVPLSESLLYGSLESLKDGEYGIVLGSYLARQLYVFIGDKVQLVLPEIQVTPAGIYPRQKQFTVVGIFDSGSQLDAELAYMHIGDAARIMRKKPSQQGWRVRLDSSNNVNSFITDFQQNSVANGWRSETWSSHFESLFRAMKMEKVTVGLLLLIIVLVAAFNIVSGLVMMVSDKRADMAVIRTMGATTGTVMRIFVIQGILLGVTGIFFGAVVGTFLAFNLSSIVTFFERLFSTQLFDPNVFYVSFLPTQWLWSDFLWVVGLSFVLTLVSTLIPAWQASKISPTEALSYKQ